MKGTLKNKEGKWVVEYEDKPIYPGSKDNFWKNGEIKQLPLHLDDANNMALQSNWLSKDKKVEFEIVDIEDPNGAPQYIKVAKLITKQGSFDEEGYAITRVIDNDVEELAKLEFPNDAPTNIQYTRDIELRRALFIRGYKAAQSKQEESIFKNIFNNGSLHIDDPTGRTDWSKIKQEESSNWDEVIERYKSEIGSSVFATNSFSSWLKEHYLPPVKR